MPETLNHNPEEEERFLDKLEMRREDRDEVFYDTLEEVKQEKKLITN